MFEFIPQPSVILTFGIATTVLALSPGPDMALFIARTIKDGRPHGRMSLAGAITGLSIHFFLVAIGVSALVLYAPTAFLTLKIIGAFYLLWLAIQAVRTGGGITLQKKQKATPTLFQSYLIGLGINLTNPKTVLFIITLLPQFVSTTDPHATWKFFFLSLEFILLATPIVLTIILMAHKIGHLLSQSQRAQKFLNWSFAAVFASFAIAILTLETKRLV